MNNEANTPPQLSLILRILGGGYLVYLAWDLRNSIQDSPLFLFAAIVFAVVGLLLAGHSLWTLARHKYFRKSDIPMIEESEETSDE